MTVTLPSDRARLVPKLEVLLGLVAMLLVLAGCGGTPGSSASTAQPVAQSGTGDWVTITIFSGEADKQLLS